jgi:signal transduction histidine kinase/DNA-binding response OmpR family regulator
MKIYTLSKLLPLSVSSPAIIFCSLITVNLLFFPNIFAQSLKADESIQKVWESGLPFITSYTPDDYKASLQNWCFTQDDDGIIYVGNTSGILEFDGVTWRLIELPNGNPVKSLAKSTDNIIYAGSVGDFGFLKSNSIGQMEFQSLLPRLDTVYRNFADIWFTFAGSDAVYFISNDYIFRWNNNVFKVWKAEIEFGFASLLNDHIYIKDEEKGLKILRNDSLTLLPEGEKFIDKKYTNNIILPYSENKVLVGSSEGGLFLYDHYKIIHFGKRGKNTLQGKRIYSGAVLPNGDYVFISTVNGCFIVDKNGYIKTWLGKKRGISSDGILGCFVDRDGNLWLATENGIDKVEISSPLRIFNQQVGLDESVDKMVFLNDKFYAATTNGIFYLKENSLDEEKKEYLFQKIIGIEAHTWDIISPNKNLLAANFSGVYQVNPDHNIKLLIPENSSHLIASSIDTNLIFAGTNRSNLYILRYLEKQWKLDKASLTVQGRILSMSENSDGSLWISTRYNGIYKIDWLTAQRSFDENYTIRHYDTTSGLPEMSYNLVFPVKNEVFFSTMSGVFRFDYVSKKFAPVTSIADQLKSTTKSFSDAIEASYDGGIWISHKFNFLNSIYNYKENKLKEISELKRISNFDINDIYDKNDIVFFGGPKGIIAYYNKLKRNYREPLSIILRKVIVGNESLLYAGHNSSGKKISLPFSKNSFRFEYALPSYNKPETNQYQYFLEGYDKDWSAWSTETQRDFTNLLEGDYVFHIRGRNIYGQISSEAAYAFTILPPLHRTWLAYLLYSLAVLGLVILIVRWRSKHLLHEKERLENVVKERTSLLTGQAKQLTQQAEQLTRQAEQLKELDKQKARFFANISHEFRTPLTLIKGPIEQVLQTPDKSVSKEDEIIIHKNADRLLRLVNQLLDLSKLDAKNLELNPVNGDIFGFLRAVGSAFSSYADQRNITYQVMIPHNEFFVMFDHDKLEKIVYNLLSNAFKFTADKGKISFSAIYENGSLKIVVADTGIGISKENLQFIFDRFYQLDNSLTRKYEGTGIGLSLTKEMVELMSGKIEVRSELDKGTEFIVALPVRGEISIPEPLAETEPATAGSNIYDDNFKLSEGIQELKAVSHRKEKGDELFILVVEDNTDMRIFIRKQLEDNYRFLEASNGYEGFEIAKSEIPDLIITDLMMPKMDGMALCSKLKTDEHTNHIPVIMLTAKAGLHHKIEGLETGADDYLIKPFDRKELQARVNNLINQREQLRKKFCREIILQPRSISITSIDEQFLKKVENVFEQYISDEEFGVPEMQNVLNMSKTQLHRKMKAVTDQAPGEFLRNYRLQRAAQLLIQKAGNVTEIAFSVGFGSLSYFTRSFKELYHLSPSEYATYSDSHKIIS